jgi:hypothetical protein
MVSGLAGHYPVMAILSAGSGRLVSLDQSVSSGCTETARTEPVPELMQGRAGEALEHGASRGN